MPPTIKDVAKAAGISTATVSRAINEPDMLRKKTLDKVFRAINKLGYHTNPLASGLKGGSSFTIGVIMPLFTNPGNMQIVAGIESVVSPAGYTLLVSSTNNDEQIERGLMNTYKKHRVDAIILSSSSHSGAYLLDYIKEDIPVVNVDRYFPSLPVDGIKDNSFDFTKELTDYVIKKGHTRIAFFMGDNDIPLCRDRYDGYLSAMQDAALAVDPLLQADVNFDKQIAYDEMRRMLETIPKKDWPSAVIVHNNNVIEGVLNAIHDAGLSIPEDISVASCGRISGYKLVFPRVTCFAQLHDEEGRAAGELALKRIRQRKAGEFPDTYIAENITVNSVFLEGESVKEIK